MASKDRGKERRDSGRRRGEKPRGPGKGARARVHDAMRDLTESVRGHSLEDAVIGFKAS